MNVPNRLTVLRILLVPLCVGLLLYYRPGKAYFIWMSFAVFIAGCLTDAADGYLARKMNLQTVLGSLLDPVADKLLLWGGFLSLSFMSHLPDSIRIPAWVTIPVITRDAVILIGSTMLYLTTGDLKAEPLLIGKATTFLQMMTLGFSFLEIPFTFKLSFYYATVALTVVSGIQYLRLGGRLLR